MRFVGPSIFLLLAVHALPAAAYRWTEAEMKAMPDYCQARFSSKDSAQYGSWGKIIGPAFIHTHHYCNGLGYLNRYYSATRALEKKRILQSAHGSFMYMVPRVDESFPMRPELYMNLGTVLSLMNRDGEALQSMRKAIELDPKLTRAYSATAYVYEKLKQKDEALKVATEGLRQNPGSAGLQRLYVKLGGQLPYPEPITPQEHKQVETTPKESGAGSGSEAPSGSEETVQREPDSRSDNAARESGRAETEVAAPPNTGSPSNPWCRFCPPEPNQ